MGKIKKERKNNLSEAARWIMFDQFVFWRELTLFFVGGRRRDQIEIMAPIYQIPLRPQRWKIETMKHNRKWLFWESLKSSFYSDMNFMAPWREQILRVLKR